MMNPVRLTDRIADVAGRLPLPGEVRFARMTGSSIAGPGAAAWVTDFLNAAYFARPRPTRDVDDLRLAFAILTTRWARHPGRRLGARDLLAFHAAYGPRRLRGGPPPRGTLDRDGLLAGAARLLGGWFAAASADPARRAHGVVFPTAAERDAFDPGRRLAHAALGALTPPREPAERQHWGTYTPVVLERPEATLALLESPDRWPDAGAENGRFTALRPGGLEGQTFEIEVALQAAPRLPLYTRGYVTCTAVHRAGDPELPGYVGSVNAGLAAHGLTPAVPDAGRPLIAVELTTHDGHFLGAALSRLLAYEHEGRAFLRDVGSWDPLPWHLEQAYALGGAEAQREFWGPDRPEASMLAQMGRVA